MSTPRDRIEAKLGWVGTPPRPEHGDAPSVPDHTLLRRIGQGAYGEVWLARNTLGSLRAIKVVYRDHFRDHRPYEREFAGIRHFEPLSRGSEGFVDILQVGRDDAGGRFYYVMELADPVTPGAASEGSVPATAPEAYVPRTLGRDLQRRGRLPLAECLELGLTLSLALTHLHRHGLIHRDIKPSNIIFIGGIPKLADIGLVTETGEANTFVGTDGFVPPEGPTSAQADLYALGKVLYEAAMGKDRLEFPEPYTGLGSDAESAALMELNAVLLRACAPDPRARYATAEEMHADLALLHSGGSVKRRQRLEQQFRRARRIGGVAVALALTAGAAWWWQQRQTVRMAELAESNARLAGDKTVLAGNLARLAEENRNRVVHLNIANGIRLLDEGDSAGALLWFAEALPLLADRPEAEAIHRIRIQQTLDRTPRLTRVLRHDTPISASAFSPDGRWVATGTRQGVQVWDASSGALAWQRDAVGGEVGFVRFSRDGQRLFASSTREQIAFNGAQPAHNGYAVLEAVSGQLLWPPPDPARSTAVTCSAFSPNDRWLAVGVGNNIPVYDLADGFRLVAELPGHADEVRYVSFGGSGEMLASASLDRTVRVWRVPSGEPVGEPLPHRFPVVRVFLDDSGEHALSASFETPGREWGEAGPWEVQGWHVPSARALGAPFTGTNWVAMFIEPGARGRAFLPADGGFGAYSFAPFALEPGRGFPSAHGWAFSGDGRQVALGGGDGLAHVHDARTGEVLAGPFRHPEWINTVALSPDGRTLLTGGQDATVRLWDLTPIHQESRRTRLPSSMQPMRPEQRGADAVQLAFYLSDGSLRLFDDDLRERHRFRSPREGAQFYGLSRATQSEVWAAKQYRPDDRTLFLWKWVGPEVEGTCLDHPATVLSWDFTSHDRHVVTYGGDRVIRFWRTVDGVLERAVPEPEPDRGLVVEISPDGRTGLWGLAGARSEHAWRFMDLESGEFTCGGFVMPGRGWTFSPDGTRVTFQDEEGWVPVVEARTGRVLCRSIKHSSNLISVQWSPDGRRLLTAGYDDAVLVWDPATGTQMVPPLRSPAGPARLARWSPDGRLVVTRHEREARVWDAVTGEAVTPRLQHPEEVVTAFMTAGRRLITASRPDLLRAWDLQPSRLPAEVLSDYARYLSGRQVDRGMVLTLTAGEMEALDRALRTRTPELFH